MALFARGLGVFKTYEIKLLEGNSELATFERNPRSGPKKQNTKEEQQKP